MYVAFQWYQAMANIWQFKLYHIFHLQDMNRWKISHSAVDLPGFGIIVLLQKCS